MPASVPTRRTRGSEDVREKALLIDKQLRQCAAMLSAVVEGLGVDDVTYRDVQGLRVKQFCPFSQIFANLGSEGHPVSECRE